MPTFLRKPPAVFPDTAGVSFCMARQVAMPGLKAMPLLDFLKSDGRISVPWRVKDARNALMVTRR